MQKLIVAFRYFAKAWGGNCSIVGCSDFPQEGRARYWPASVEGSVGTTAVDSPTREHIMQRVRSSKCRS